MKIIIIGAGEVGFQIAEKLCGEKIDVVIIEKDEDRQRQIEEHLDVQFILGSGASPELLQRAGITEAAMVIAVSDQDEVNLIACLVANHYSPGSRKIARVRDPSYLKSPEAFEHLNFDLFINPEFQAAKKLARLMKVPQALDLIPFADGRVLLMGIQVESSSILVNRKMFSLGDLIPEYTPLVAAIYRGKEVIVPRGADVLRAGDIVYFSVTSDKIPSLLKLSGKKADHVEKVILYGGGNTGLYLAQELEETGLDLKLIEPDEARCAYLADQLTRTTVLHGEGMDRDLLLQENIADMDVFAAVSKDTEDNILSALLAKSLGVKYAMIVSSRTDYTTLVSTLGIDAVVSPQLAAVSRVMRFLRRGKVVTVEAVREQNAEGIEFVAMETSEAVNTPLKEIEFPRGALVMAVVRGEEVIIPGGETIILPDDRVIIFAKRDAIAKVEKLFSVKLKYF